MNIALIGAQEKNLIVLPILKILSTMGDTCYITKDYATYYNDKESYVNNTNIIITADSFEEVWEGRDFTQAEFNHILYNMIDELPSPIDKVIHVKWDFEEPYEDRELVEDEDTVDIILKGKLTPNAEDLIALAKTRITGTLIPSKNKNFMKELSKKLSPVFNMPPSELLKRMMHK